MSEKKLIPVDDIAIDTTQARRGDWEDDEKDKTLIDSIKGIGLIYDIIVRPTNSKKYGGKTDKPYALIAGSRRLNALIRAGITDIPCKIMDMEDTEAIAMSFSENIGRKDLSEFQKMITILTWIDLLMKSKYIEGEEQERKIKTINEIADIAFGGDSRRVYDVLQIERLPKKLQILIKKPEERTEEEILILKEYDIKPDFKMNFQTLGVIENIYEQLGEITTEEKTQKIFEIIKELALDDKKAYKYIFILRDIRDKLKEAKTFEIVMKEVKEEHNIHTPTMKDLPSISQFKLPEEYRIWHNNALIRTRMKATQLVRSVYLKWLEREAKKEGW